MDRCTWHFAWARRSLAVAVLWLAFGTAFAQRTEGDVVAGARGLYEAEVKVNSQGEAERNAGFARAHDHRAGQAHRRSVRAEPARRGAGAAPRQGFREELRLPPGRGSLGHGRAHVQHDAGRPLRPGTDRRHRRHARPAGVGRAAAQARAVAGDRRRPRAAPGRARRRPTPRAPCSIARRNAVIASACRRAAPPNRRPSAPSGAATRPPSRALSSRYSPPMQLIGKLYRAKEGGGWTAEWTFVDAGKVLSTWTSSQPDARRAMATGADGAADALSKKYAKRSTAAGEPGRYTVQIDGMRNADDYIRLMSLPAGPARRARHGAGARGTRRLHRRTGADHRHAGPARAWSPTATCCWPKKTSPSCTCADEHRPVALRAPHPMGGDHPDRRPAGLAARADPHALRVRRDARLARRSAGRSACRRAVGRATSRWSSCSAR